MRSFVSLYITAVIGHRSGSFINLILISLPPKNSECSRNNKEKKCPSAFLQVCCERGLGSHSGIVAISLFPQKKQNSAAVHLRLRAASEKADPKSTRSDGPTGHTLSCFPNIWGRKQSCLLLRLSNFSARSSSSLYFWSSRYSWGLKTKETRFTSLNWNHETQARTPGQPSKRKVAPTVITLIWFFLSKTSNPQFWWNVTTH